MFSSLPGAFLLFSQKKLGKLKQTDEVEADCGRNPAVLQVHLLFLSTYCITWTPDLQCSRNKQRTEFCSLHSLYNSGTLWMKLADPNTAGSPPTARSRRWACLGLMSALDQSLKTFMASQRNTCRAETLRTKTDWTHTGIQCLNIQMGTNTYYSFRECLCFADQKHFI